MNTLPRELPGDTPIEFWENLIPENKLIHRGIFSPDLEEYFYAVSDKDFTQFDVYVTKIGDGQLAEPQRAFFNSEYNEHGMSFSPDGNSIYFSSTRPVNILGVSETWHIWRSDKVDGVWSEPSFVDIPNLRHKLVSHPTIASSGTLYCHVSELDYSNMDIYHSTQVNERFLNAEKTNIWLKKQMGKCTPFVSPKEDYLIFATIGHQLDLMISYNDGKGNWINTKRLNDRINQYGQGNPYVTPDNALLFYASGNTTNQKWKVNWVNIESELKKTARPINS
ncbi:hypothetical protein GU926_07740 [Nibribacter ruber]|uniref:Exo-alpha-sialidase n=1 Tax=Nibribacter ruber TaxID=2698458 RepID=A0A6P1NW92_9BACT|nr:PD40 domain-containing protein [Nibribacter ruber]QHL87330.1 hypothetical protein GU926_07740 [Nibribacter ruber]